MGERRGDENRRWELRLNGGSRSGQLRKSRHSASHFASHVTSDYVSNCASHYASHSISHCASHFASYCASDFTPHCASPSIPHCASHFTSHSVSSPSSCDGHSGAHLLYLFKVQRGQWHGVHQGVWRRALPVAW